jgi:hypothetical protein
MKASFVPFSDRDPYKVGRKVAWAAHQNVEIGIHRGLGQVAHESGRYLNAGEVVCIKSIVDIIGPDDQPD